MTSPSPLDAVAIDGLRALSPDTAFLRELIEIFLQDTPTRLKELDAALAASDAATVTRAAHSIKGSAGNFGAMRLSELAHRIELLGKAANLPAVDVTELKSEYARVAEALTRIALEG
jgi:HPt (histidine-containing phosphotransfer) domain-containing protein